MSRLRRASWIAVALAACFAVAIAGCRPTAEPERGADEHGAAAAVGGPRFTNVVLFVNNYHLGERHGCYSDGLQPSGELMCGPSDGPALVTWRFLGNEGGKDIYEIRRVFPVDGKSPGSAIPRAGSKQMEKKVSYSGGVLVAMEDDVQRVVLYPKGAPYPPTITATTTRAP